MNNEMNQERPEPVLMTCGHVANCKQVLSDGTRIPACTICGCSTIAEEKPSLDGRKARCFYCSCKKEPVDSNYRLAFFEYKPSEEYDKYYCGCYGWN